jgi:hypothetical protein
MPNLLSGRKPVIPATKLTSSRYKYVSLEQAKPALGSPDVDSSVLIGRTDGTTEWIPQSDIQTDILPTENVLFVSKNGNDLYPGNSITAPKPSITSAINSAVPGTTIIVFSGEYTENNPIVCPADVTIIGEDSRVIIIPQNPQLDVFHLSSGSTIEFITVKDHQSPSFAFSILPYATFTTAPTIKDCTSISGPYLNNGVKFIPNETVQNPSIGATALPLIANSQVPDAAYRINSSGAGGGVRVDGVLFSILSTIKYAYVDKFIAINQGGIGILAENGATIYADSCMTKFCSISYNAESGATLNTNACSTEYGAYGLFSDNYNYDPYISNGIVSSSIYSQLLSITLSNQGDGYDPANLEILVGRQWTPSTYYNLYDQVCYGPYLYVVILSGTSDSDPANFPTHYVGSELNGSARLEYAGLAAIVTPTVVGGKIVEIIVEDGGYGYSELPSITFVGPHTTEAIAQASLSGIQEFIVYGINKVPLQNTLIGFASTSPKYFISSVVQLTGTTASIKVTPTKFSVFAGDSVNMYYSSIIKSNSHNFGYVGSGVTYNALPTNSGVPRSTREIYETNYGKVFCSSINERGIYKVGTVFSVDILTKTTTLDASTIDFTNLGAVGPLIRNGAPSGVQLKEISNDPELKASNGFIDQFTVPTQEAIVTYLENNYISTNGDSPQNIVGELTINDLIFSGNSIRSANPNQDIVLTPNGTGKLDLSSSRIINGLPPINGNDLATKSYVDSVASSGLPILSYTTTTAIPTVIDTFDTTVYRTAKYLVQVTSNNKYHSTEIILIHDGANVNISQYGEIFTISKLGIFSSSLVSGILNLIFTPDNDATQINVQRQYITV